MSTATALPYAGQPAPGKAASIFLALAVHALLLAFLFYGIRWQTQRPAAIEVELVMAAPPSEPLAIEPPPAPPPEAKPLPEPPKVEAPTLPPPKPEIAIKEKEKEKPKPKTVPPKVVPKPQANPFQKQLEQELKQTSERKTAAAVNAAATQELAQMKAAQASAARSKAEADYIGKIKGKIKGNIVLPIDLKGNPEAQFDVVQLPSGEILSAKLKKSSGHAGYDTAVERAILKSSPLPKPERGDVFQRELLLKFRPLEE